MSLWVSKKVRHPRIELGPPRWQRGIIATRLMALASTGNRTRATCLEGRYSNHWTIDACVIVTSATGFEPARAEPTRFQVWLLNHSDTLTRCTIRNWIFIWFLVTTVVAWLKFCSAFKKSFYTSATVTLLFEKIESEAEGQCTYNSP